METQGEAPANTGASYSTVGSRFRWIYRTVSCNATDPPARQYIGFNPAYSGVPTVTGPGK